MTKSDFLRLIPIAVLLLLCIILGGIILSDRLGNEEYIPTIADMEGNGETDKTQDTDLPETEPSETEPPETVPPETEPPETEPPEVDISSKGLEFTSLGNGTCYISGMGSCQDSFVILPKTSPYGETVIGIGDYAFRNSKTLKCIELGADLKFVGAYAFYGTDIVNVFIPRELEQIGDYAFSNCRSLENINVDGENTLYRDIDGVLYSKDGEELICYPQGKLGNSISLSMGVEEIKTMAFYNCSQIKLINYNGSASSFRRIKVGAGNECFEDAVVTYVEGNIGFGIYEK